MKKIKIIHPITRLILGGAQQNTMETCNHLNPDRFSAQIISGADTGPEGELISEVRQRGIPLTIIPELIRAPHPVKDFIALKKMTAYFKAEKPHIVHTHSSKAGILGRWAARRAGVPVIVHTVHGWGQNKYQSFMKRNLFVFLEKRAEKITDRLIVVSYLNAEKGLKDKIGSQEKYTTIHSSIDINLFGNCGSDIKSLKKKLGLNPEAPVVGTVGRFSEQKNPCDFVRMAAAVKKKVPEAEFIIVGDGPLRFETENFIKTLGLSKDIVIPGLRTDIAALIGCMDVFVLTSLWEGLPRVIPQAMAGGVPVVANAVDGVCEVIREGENGFVVQPGEVSLMAEKIVKLLLNSSLKKDIGRRGRQTAEKEFSLKDMIDKIENLYEELLAGKAVRI